MEYLPGGDLYSLLQEFGSLDENTSRIYTFQIATALAYLHSHGIIHRDIKPDNILVSADGFLKLTDFGLSYIGLVGRHINKEAESDGLVQTNSMVGTPDYIAPEIVMNHSHSFSVDWWSLGVMVYEFFYGIPPFHSDSEKQIHDNIIHGRYVFLDEQKTPDNDFADIEISDTAKDLIRKLLQVDPEKRLGAHGSVEVLSHPWFEGLKIGEIEPPFIPKLANPEDTQYFTARYQFDQNDDSDILSDICDASASVHNVRARAGAHIVAHKRSRSVTNSALLLSPTLLVSGSLSDLNNLGNDKTSRNPSLSNLSFNDNSFSDNLDDGISTFPTVDVGNEELEDKFPSIAITQLEDINKKELSKAKSKVHGSSRSFAALDINDLKPKENIKAHQSFIASNSTPADDMFLPNPDENSFNLK